MLSLEDMKPYISIIVPLYPGESEWVGLARDVRDLSTPLELIFVGPNAPQTSLAVGEWNGSGEGRRFSWVRAPLGRARQLNCGARAAKGKFLWFLHADSRLDFDTFAALEHALEKQPEVLHYFDLGFLPDAPSLMKVTAAAALLRSRLLRLPCGEQGFCVERQVFWRAGGFDESLRYGEDHRFVWQAMRVDIPVRGVGAKILKSAREYQEYGWVRTSMRQGWRLYRLALPEWIKTKTLHL